MTQLTDKLYAVEVPDDSEQLETSMQDDGIPCLTYCAADNTDPSVQCLPPGTYRFLFTTKTATEEDARKVVLSSEWYFPEGHTRYVDYAHPYDTKFKQQ